MPSGVAVSTGVVATVGASTVVAVAAHRIPAVKVIAAHRVGGVCQIPVAQFTGRYTPQNCFACGVCGACICVCNANPQCHRMLGHGNCMCVRKSACASACVFAELCVQSTRSCCSSNNVVRHVTVCSPYHTCVRPTTHACAVRACALGVRYMHACNNVPPECVAAVCNICWRNVSIGAT